MTATTMKTPPSWRGLSVNRNLAGTGLARVISLPGKDVPHAALRIWGIACVTGDQVDVDVVDTLSGSCVHINANVIAVGTEFSIEYLSLRRN